jgi:hypothetical protein
MEKDPPHRDKMALPVSAASTSAYIFNCSAFGITKLLVNNNNVLAPSQSLAGISASSPPNSLSVPLSTFINSLGTPLAIYFEGNSKPTWSQTVFIQQTYLCIYLWCYSNGFMLADQNGNIFYMYGQSSASLMAELTGKHHVAGRKFSVAL